MKRIIFLLIPIVSFFFAKSEELNAKTTSDYTINDYVLNPKKILENEDFSRPRFFDKDGDGSPELLISEKNQLKLYEVNQIVGQDPQLKILEWQHPFALDGKAYSLVPQDINTDGRIDYVMMRRDNESIKVTWYLTSASGEILPQQTLLITRPAENKELSDQPLYADCGDINNDGLPDIVASGGFESAVTLYLNKGTSEQWVFDEGIDITGKKTNYPFPMLVDFDKDGDLDLLITIKRAEALIHYNDSMDFQRTYEFRGAGFDNELQNKTSSYLYPTFIDLNNDKAMEWFFSGGNGKLFYSLVPTLTEGIKDIETCYSQIDPSSTITLPEVCYSGLQTIRSHTTNQTFPNQTLSDLGSHIRKYPIFYQSKVAQGDLAIYVSSIRIAFLNSSERIRKTNQFVARALNFQGGRKLSLVRYGVMLEDNYLLKENQVDAAYLVLETISKKTWDLQEVRFKKLLGTPIDPRARLKFTPDQANSVPTPIGSTTNTFPTDAPDGGDRIDRFVVTLAHELNHHSFTNRSLKIWNQEVFNKRDLLIRKSSAPYIKFNSNNRFDLKATQAEFLAQGFWDGQSSSWNLTFRNFFERTSQGIKVSKQFLRGGAAYLMQNPQELFPGMCNQYFNNTDIMLRLAIKRFKQGYVYALEGFFLLFDFFTTKQIKGVFVDFDPNGKRTKELVLLKRSNDLVNEITLASGVVYKFERREDGSFVSAEIINPASN